MKIANLRNTGDDTDVLDAVRTGPCAPVVIERIEDGEIYAGLLIDGPLGPSGKQFKLTQPRGLSVTLKEIAYGKTADGRRPTPPSAVGDLLIFENAIHRAGSLMVGELATRIHDGLEGPVQVARVLARPTRISVSEKGVTQYVSLMDPSKSAVISSLQDLNEFMRACFSAEWPGGHPAVAFRKDGLASEVALDSDGKWMEKPEAFAKRMVEVNELLGDGPVEAIPLWSLPVSLDQARRDVDIRKPTSGKVTGPFTALYGTRNQSFKPSVVILTDEDEFAFGGPTGRKIRSVAGMHPLRTDLEIRPSNVPTATLNKGHAVSSLRLMYKTPEAIEQLSAQRAQRLAARPEFARPKPKANPEGADRRPPARGEQQPREPGTHGNLKSLMRSRAGR